MFWPHEGVVMAAAVLYSFRRCPYAMRARMTLCYAGVDFELREVALKAKPAALIAASPKATVPVLVLEDGRVLDQSLDIMVFALAQSDPEAWLDGWNDDGRALVARNDGPFKRSLDCYKYPARFGLPVEAGRAEGLGVLSDLNERLAQHAYVMGPRLSLVDVALFPFVRQFAGVDQAWFDRQDLSHLHRWLSGLIGSDLFGHVMARYPTWCPGDEPVIFPRLTTTLSCQD
jgi:glutathione S-transferase